MLHSDSSILWTILLKQFENICTNPPYLHIYVFVCNSLLFVQRKWLETNCKSINYILHIQYNIHKFILDFCFARSMSVFLSPFFFYCFVLFKLLFATVYASVDRTLFRIAVAARGHYMWGVCSEFESFRILYNTFLIKEIIFCSDIPVILLWWHEWKSEHTHRSTPRWPSFAK